jgi:hypothetical protein
VPERLINRGRQGAIGESSAIDWLTRVGATVSLPFGPSPDYDLVADIDGSLLRVQVKTSTVSTSRRLGTAGIPSISRRTVATRAGAASRRSSTHRGSTFSSHSSPMGGGG